MKISTIIGARPQYIKAAPLSAALKSAGITEFLVDTGQHYDSAMAGNFFSELGLPSPSHSLGIGSGTHGQMTGRMLEKIELVLREINPEAVIVYGDTNTTLAGALAAAKMAIPVIHIEAGLRSYRSAMPEEINRCLTDHMSRILVCPTSRAVENLKKEGISSENIPDSLLSEKECSALRPGKAPLVINAGDIMVDALMTTRKKNGPMPLVDKLGSKNYILVTLHRAESTDDPVILENLIRNIADLGQEENVLFPVHPRTRKKMSEKKLFSCFENTKVFCLAPLSYEQFVKAQANARVIITDSGGVQKEACMLGTPCLTLREETEWTETVETGWNRLLGLHPPSLLEEVRKQTTQHPSVSGLYGDGKTAQRITTVIQACFG